MDIKLSLIADIDINKVMFDGSAYIIEEEKEESDISFLMKHSFDNVINSIVSQYEKEDTYQSINNIHENINEYLKSTEGVKKTIILLQDSGLRGVDKVNYALNSILFFKISEEFGLGFFVNKTLATFLTSNLNYIDKK